MQTQLQKRISGRFNDVYNAGDISEATAAANKLATTRGVTPANLVRLTEHMNMYDATTPTSHKRSEGFIPGRRGGKRRRTCRKRILNKNMKPMHKSMHKSMHRGRCGKRRSFRKYWVKRGSWGYEIYAKVVFAYMHMHMHIWHN